MPLILVRPRALVLYLNASAIACAIRHRPAARFARWAALAQLASLVAPPRCAACGAACRGSSSLCAECLAEARGRTPRHRARAARGRPRGCGRGVRRRRPANRPWTQVRQAPDARARRFRRDARRSAGGGAAPRAVVPVPAGPWRWRWRGSTPPEEIAIAVSERSGVALRACLRRSGGRRQVGRRRASGSPIHRASGRSGPLPERPCSSMTSGRPAPRSARVPARSGRRVPGEWWRSRSPRALEAS